MTDLITQDPNDTGEIARPISPAAVASAMAETRRIYVGEQTAVITGAEQTGVIPTGVGDEKLRRIEETLILDTRPAADVDIDVPLDDRPYPPVPKPLPPQPTDFTPITRPEPKPVPAPPPAPKWAEPSAEYPPVLLRRSMPYVMPDDRQRTRGGRHRRPISRFSWALIGSGVTVLLIAAGIAVSVLLGVQW